MSADKIDKLYQNYDVLMTATEKSEVGFLKTFKIVFI